MAVPSSGQLRLRGDIALEVDGSATGINVSLRTLSASAGFSIPDTMSEFYGYSSSVAPTVTTGTSSSSNTSVYMTGTVNSDGGATITERGFYFGTSTNATSNPKYIVSGTTGNYNLNRTGLSTNTTYRYFAYATNASGTTIGAMGTRATYPTLNYTWQSTSYGTSLYNYAFYFNANYAKQYGINYMNHPYLGQITYSSGSFNDYSYPSNSDGVANFGAVGKLTTAGYNSSNVWYVRTQYSPSTWQTNQNQEIIAFVHPTPTEVINSNSHIIGGSWGDYNSTGYRSYVVTNETTWSSYGGQYQSEGNQSLSLTVAGS